MRSTLILTLLLIFSWSAFSQNPTPFPNGFRLGIGVEENTTTDSIRVVTINENGISKVIAKDSLVSWLDIPVPEQYFKSITEGSNTGYVHKYRADNPANYGNIGSNAVDLSFSNSASSTMGATGWNSFAAGSNTTASHDQTVAMGNSSQATGIRSVAIGSQNTASGSSSVAIGAQNTASNEYAVALGRSNVASVANATAMGYGNTASGQISTAMGRGNTANSYYSTFIGGWGTVFTGQNASSIVSTDILFNIGNGTSTGSRSNALSLFKNGRLELPSYGDGTFTGTATKLLAVDTDGKVIEEDLPSGWTLTVTDDDEVSVTEVDTINFTNATVIDNEDGSVDVTVPVGITVVDDDNTETYNNIEALIFEGVTITDNEDGSVTIPISGGGGSLTVTDDDTVDVSDVDTINFIGATVTDNEDGSVDVEFSGGGGSLTVGSDNQIPYSNSSGDDFDYSADYTFDGEIATISRNNTNTTSQLNITQSGTGDAGIGILAGNRGVSMGIDNSDSDLFKISINSGSIPNIGGGSTLISAEMGTTLTINPYVIGLYTNSNYYNGITTSGYSYQTNVTNYTRLLNSGIAIRNGLEQFEFHSNGYIRGRFGGDITLDFDTNSEGTFTFPDLGDDNTTDVIVTETTQTVKQAKVTIAAADLRECYSTPITLIPAQGVNTTIDLINIVGYIDYDSVVYNFGDNLTITQNSYEHYNIDNTIINGSTAVFFKTSYEVNGFIASFSDTNVPIQLTSSSDATQGDSDVTLIITYTVNQF